MQTTEGEQISQLIAGYIDIILKKVGSPIGSPVFLLGKGDGAVMDWDRRVRIQGVAKMLMQSWSGIVCKSDLCICGVQSGSSGGNSSGACPSGGGGDKDRGGTWGAQLSAGFPSQP